MFLLKTHFIDVIIRYYFDSPKSEGFETYDRVKDSIDGALFKFGIVKV